MKVKALLFCSHILFFGYIIPIVGFSQSAWRPVFPTFNNSINNLQPVSDSEVVVKADDNTFCVRLNSVSGAVDTLLLPQSNINFTTMHWKNRAIGVFGLLRPNNTGRGRYFTKSTTDAGQTWIEWQFPENDSIPYNFTHASMCILEDGSFYDLLTSQLLAYVQPFTNHVNLIRLPAQIDQISFLDRNRGWCVGKDTLLITLDGGASWRSISKSKLAASVKKEFAFIYSKDSLRVITISGDEIRHIPLPPNGGFGFVDFDAYDAQNMWGVVIDENVGTYALYGFKPESGWIHFTHAPEVNRIRSFNEKSLWVFEPGIWGRSKTWYYTSTGGITNDSLIVSNLSTYGVSRCRAYVSVNPYIPWQSIQLERRLINETEWLAIGELKYPATTYWDEGVRLGEVYQYRASISYSSSNAVMLISNSINLDSIRHIDLLQYFLIPNNREHYYSCQLEGKDPGKPEWSRRELMILSMKDTTHYDDHNRYSVGSIVFDPQWGKKYERHYSLNESFGYHRHLYANHEGVNGYNTLDEYFAFPPITSASSAQELDFEIIDTDTVRLRSSYPLSRFLQVPSFRSVNLPEEIRLSAQANTLGTHRTIHSYKRKVGPVLISSYRNSGMYWRRERATLDSITTATSKLDIFSYYLHQNYPNPFNPGTTICFTLPRYDHAVLRVYDVFGKLVATLVDGWFEAGEHEFHFRADNTPSGVYLYVLQTEENRITKKMVLMK